MTKQRILNFLKENHSLLEKRFGVETIYMICDDKMDELESNILKLIESLNEVYEDK